MKFQKAELGKFPYEIVFDVISNISQTKYMLDTVVGEQQWRWYINRNGNLVIGFESKEDQTLVVMMH